MDRVENPVELEALAKSITSLFVSADGKSDLCAELYAQYERANPQPLWEKLFGSEKREYAREKYVSDKINKKLEDNLSERIEITPEIAYFLLQDQQLYAAKKTEIDAKDNSIYNAMTMTGSVGWALLFPSPIAAGGVAYGIGKLIINAKQHEKDLIRILNERDEICRSILLNYKLQESEPGKYELIRGKSEVYGWVADPKFGTLSYSSSIKDAGVAPDFDAETLKSTIKEKIFKARNERDAGKA